MVRKWLGAAVPGEFGTFQVHVATPGEARPLGVSLVPEGREGCSLHPCEMLEVGAQKTCRVEEDGASVKEPSPASVKEAGTRHQLLPP